jgi:hypothetical protein
LLCGVLSLRYSAQAKLEELETELLEVNANTERLTRTHSELVELQLVLEKAGNFFEHARVEAQSENLDRPLGAGEDIGVPLLVSVLRITMYYCATTPSKQALNITYSSARHARVPQGLVVTCI